MEASLTRAVLDEAKSTYLSGSTFAVNTNEAIDQTDDAGLSPVGPNPMTNSKIPYEKYFSVVIINQFLCLAYKSLTLLQSVTSTVNEVCKKLKLDEKSFKSVRTGRVIPCSVHAVKNGRRKMEDRHVTIHDLNAIYFDNQVLRNNTAFWRSEHDFSLQSNEPSMSFYGVYDGHAGKDAAAFAASHLHSKIFTSVHYPTDTIAAIKDAFKRTDEAFLEKVRPEKVHST